MAIIITLVAIFLVLVLNEIIWRKLKLSNEASRKLIHISVGVLVAFWPFFLNWDEIKLFSLAFLIVVTASKYLHIFKSIHSVQRLSIGEICFAMASGVTAFITHNKWVFMAAMLQMSLADGMAAIIGIRYGRRRQYSILGNTKSLAGTLTFFVVSVLILLNYAHFSGHALPIWKVGIYALGASALENIAIYGVDNILLPVALSLALTYL